MTINTAWSIDWLSITFKGDVTDLDIRRATAHGFPLKTWSQVVARFGYAQAFIHPFGHIVMANYSRPEMGVHLSYTGRSLRELAQGGVRATSLLDWALQGGGKISRLDLAIDVFDEAIDIVALAACDRVKDAPGSARKWSTIAGHDGGSTAYVGSRKSEKFLRIYDKGIETGDTSRPWIRFELELKGDSARAAALQMNLLSDAERPQFIKGLIRALFNPNDPIFQAAMDAEAVQLATIKDTDDNTVMWLVNTVAKAMAKTMSRRADVDVWDLFSQAVHENLKAMGHVFEDV